MFLANDLHFHEKCGECGKDYILTSTDNLCSDHCRKNYQNKQPCYYCGKTADDKSDWENYATCKECGILYKKFLVYRDEAIKKNTDINNRIREFQNKMDEILPEGCFYDGELENIFMSFTEDFMMTSEQIIKMAEKLKTIDLEKMKSLYGNIRNLQKEIIVVQDFFHWKNSKEVKA